MRRTLLIVDDEHLVRRLLRTRVDWQRYGIEIVGEAADGSEGVAVAQREKPDIVITDIKMPGLDGLAMLKEIAVLNPRTKFIILSGYDTFELAKSAFSSGVVDYLLKNIDFDQLDIAVRKALSILEEEEGRTRAEERAEEALRRGTAALKNEALVDLLKGRSRSTEALEEKLALAGIDAKDRAVAVFLFMADKAGRDLSADWTRLADAYGKIIAFVEAEKLGHGVCLGADTLAVLSDAEGIRETWMRILAEHLILKFIPEEWGVRAGIGETYRDLNRVKHSFIEAEVVLKHPDLCGAPAACFSGLRSLLHRRDNLDYPVALERTLLEGFRNVSRETLSGALDGYFAALKGCHVEIRALAYNMIEMLFSLKRGLDDVKLDSSHVFVDAYGEIYALLDAGSVSEVRETVVELVDRVFRFVEATAQRGVKRIVREILDFIDAHYAEPGLTLALIGKKVLLTPNYISAIVKQETGENFSELVVKRRIEKAKELMGDATMRSYQIAEAVGYTDHSHFSRLFKKFVGMTPNEFRNKFCT